MDRTGFIKRAKLSLFAAVPTQKGWKHVYEFLEKDALKLSNPLIKSHNKEVDVAVVA